MRRSSKVSTRRKLQWQEHGQEGQDLSCFDGPARVGGPPKTAVIPEAEGGEKNQTRKESKRKAPLEEDAEQEGSGWVQKT